MQYTDSVLKLKGIGEKTGTLLHKINISTIQELLTYYPREYETFEHCIPIAKVIADEVCAVKATVAGGFSQQKIRNLMISKVKIQDTTGFLYLTFFNMPYLSKSLKSGETYIFRGLVKKHSSDTYVMEQAKIYTEDEYLTRLDTLQPIYPLTKGIGNTTLQKAVKQALEVIEWKEETLPQHILTTYHLIDYQSAITAMHRPVDMEHLLTARRRLVFEEFFLFIQAIRALKEQTVKQKNENRMFEVADTARLLESLPYTLTQAQHKVWEEIKQDMTGDVIMNRLIQGDVGSGKTILAILALLMCAANGCQGAMMAPTEVLAKQHYETCLALTAQYHLPIRPILLVGSLSAKEKKEAYALIASGEVNVILGTHALIQDKVSYHKLALVVTDEQHRFGVRQRDALAGKGNLVHVLVMSATPIPRTLAIVLYGDLHISVLDELPADRQKIKNCVVNTSYRNTAYTFIQQEITSGRQAYIVCPMVEEGEFTLVENVTDYAALLRQIFPPQIQIGVLHGKMRPADKNRIMEAFKQHDIDILVSTTVIEVGINVPNATVMMIENAERFGLAQLHQLRGRVGRGKEQSYCIFVSANTSPKTMERLEILKQSNDGFYIAEEDLKLRGPGDVFGIRQSGLLEFKLGDIYTDAAILRDACECVEQLSSYSR
ncbi:MAG: ATP-dependent DNA helicase RecG [Lachnospiraceae bacterium]